MADDLAKLRAELNIGAIDTPQFIKAIQAAYQNMPGAGVAQASLATGSDMAGNLLGNLYGVGKQVATGQLGTPQGTAYAFNQAQDFANQMHYTPPTQAGRDIYEGVNKLPQVVTGSHMGVGPLPEIWNNAPKFTPDDLRVLAKTGIEDVRNFPSDYANAQAGITREYPTLGSRAAGATETAGNVAKPFVEPIYNQVMETGGFNVPGMPNQFNVPVASYAVKPKGGNWPTNLGSTNPLSEQGAIGEHLSRVQYDDPVAVFEAQLKNHYPRSIDNRQLLRDWEDFWHSYVSNGDFDVTKTVPELRKEAADAFAEAYNNKTIGAADINQDFEKPLHTASKLETTLPHYNSWVMGPYQKYITNQMGTGLATDPLLQAVNESGMPPHEIFGQTEPRDWDTSSITERAERRREDFPDRLYGWSSSPEKRAALENSPIGKITATTPSGVTYENALDASLYPKGTHSFRVEQGFPALAKLDRDALITDFLTDPEDRAGFTEIRKKVFQGLLSGELDPAKLSNVTPATVTRQMIKDRMAEYKEAQLSKKGAEEWIPKRAAAMPTDMAFPDGSKMTIITPEIANADEAMTARDLGQITIDLNQCVGSGCHATQDYPGHGPYVVPHTGKPPRGKVEYDKYGYMRRLKEGSLEIASLKDPQGVSQATLELKPEGKSIDSASAVLKRHREIKQWLAENAPEKLDQYKQDFSEDGLTPRIMSKLWDIPGFDEFITTLTGSPKKSIQQIKGHTNQKVQPEFSEHLREWLNQNADNLTRVSELNNVPDVHDLTDHYVSIDNLTSKNKDWSIEAVEKLFHDAEDKKLLPRFFNAKQFADLAEQLSVDLTEDPIHASGGGLSPVAQRAYGGVSQQIVDTFEDDYVREAFSNGNNPALTTILREIQERPIAYGLGNYSPAVRNQVIQALREEANRKGELGQMADAVQGMEPELYRPNANALDYDRRALTAYLNGQELDFNQKTPDVRILMGNQAPNARLPRDIHESLVESFLNQDDERHASSIRYIINTLQGPGYFPSMPELTTPQLENILDMAITWTERYPLREQ